MDTRAPKVIYITGLAYSGTTLLSSALGQSENVFNAGEVNYLENDYHENKICSCGQKVDDCKVWGHVLNRLERDAQENRKTLTFSGEKTLRAIDERAKPFRIKILTLLGVRPEYLYDEKELKDYALRHENFMHLLSSTIDVDFVVDASKNFTRLYVLHQYTDLCVHVIYVRRTAIQSYASRLKRAKRRNKFYISLFAPGYLILMFIQTLGIRRRLKTFNPQKVSIIDYETFTENSQVVEAQLSKELGISVNLGIRENEFSLDHLHVFTGNRWLPEAVKTTKKVAIKSNDGRVTLSWFERLSFQVLQPIFKLFS